MKAFLRDILVTLLLAGVFTLLLRNIIAIPPSEVASSSMEPTLKIGQRVIISKITYKFHEPERGDIITFHSPSNQREDYIKRIIGLPGESVEIIEGKVYIHKEDSNMLTLEEPYILKKATQNFRGGIIPENEYFVLGDNRNNSSDSREGWTISRRNIIGKAWLSIWPPDRWGLAANYSYQNQ